MDLYLQFGHGMMEHCRHLAHSWGGATVVLSPRDLRGEQLQRLAADLTKIGGSTVLLDPQFYLPHSDHSRLCSHDYWPKDYETGAFWQGPGLGNLLGQLETLNRAIESRAILLPGLMATAVTDDWLAVQRLILETAASRSSLERIATIALSADATRDPSQIAAILEEAVNWPVQRYYLVFEHPNGDYLVDDPVWLANALDMVAGLRIAGATVHIGYCNHQMLLAAAAGAKSICSGTWMNVRAFSPDKFSEPDEEEIRQKTTWFYCPQALSEYTLPFLDLAFQQGLLGGMAPPPALDGGYTNPLFSGARPTSVGLVEQLSFRHYLHALRQQARMLRHGSFDETVTACEQMFVFAEGLLKSLTRAGVRGKQRDFSEFIDVGRSALATLQSTRGPMLRRKW